MTETTASTTPVESGPAISYGWETVKKNFWYFVGMALVVALISGLASDRHPQDGVSNSSLLGLLLSAWMACGYWTLIFSYMDGKKRPFEDLFTQLKPFWRLLGASLLVGIIIGVGFFFLIVPGFYFLLKYQFTVPLIVDRNLGITEAMRQSAKLSDHRKMSLLGFDLTCLGVIILGAICLGVGVFVAIPVVWLAMAAVYRKLSGAGMAAA